MSVNGIPSTTVPPVTSRTTAATELEGKEEDLLTLSGEEGDSFTTGSTGETSGTTPPEDLKTMIARIKGEIEKLKEQIEKYDEQIAEINERLKTEQGKLAAAEAVLKPHKDELERLQEELASKQEQYSKITDAIEAATKSLEEDAKVKQQKAIYEAMAEYDEEKDGDWDAYLEKKLSGVMDETALSNLISSLSGQSKDLMRELGTLQTKISVKADLVKSAQVDVDACNTRIAGINQELATAQTNKTTAENKITQLNTEMSTAVAKKAISEVSDGEKQLVKDLGIDLTEKFEDGSPKYILAPGKSDGKYHIYEKKSPDDTSPTSLARLYGKGGGYDIVPSGNGYMYGLKCAPCGEGEMVVNLDCVNEDMSEGKGECNTQNYSTSSPLSFDINGDGVRTSDKMIKYDIDGDGKLDNINDSADGILCFDADGDGISGESGLECFGDNTDLDGDGKADGFKNGFEALKALAFKENLINGKDDNKLDENDIKALEDKYGLKIKLDGYNSEAVSLFNAGITEINFSTTNETNLEDNFDGRDNQLMTQDGATFKTNGEVRTYADIWHAKK